MKRYMCLVILAVCLVNMAVVAAGGECQILDNRVKPIYGANLSFVTDAQFGEYGDSGFVELGGYWDGPYLMDVFGCDIGLSLNADLKFLTSDADVALPSQVGALALDADFVWRCSGGTSFRIGISPGIYSDLAGLGGRSVDVPVSVDMIQAFNPYVSGIIGMQIRPRFLTMVMPVIGVEWEVVEELRVSAMLPESRVTWFMLPDWSTHVGFEWNNMSYGLNEGGDFDREQVEIEDFRLSLGVTHRLSDEFQLTGALGTVFGRSVEFREDAEGLDSSLDVENGVILSVAVGGPF